MGDPHFPSQPIIQPDSQDYQKGRNKENTKKEPQPAQAMRQVKSLCAAVRSHKIIPLTFLYQNLFSRICRSKKEKIQFDKDGSAQS
jgi:hypothetical protein